MINASNILRKEFKTEKEIAELVKDYPLIKTGAKPLDVLKAVDQELDNFDLEIEILSESPQRYVFRIVTSMKAIQRQKNDYD